MEFIYKFVSGLLKFTEPGTFDVFAWLDPIFEKIFG